VGDVLDSWKVRNKMLWILCLVYVVAFLDRANFNIAAPYIAKDLQLNPSQMGMIMSAFLIGYGWLQVLGGIMADRWGGRKTLVFAIIWWSIFTAATGLAGGFMSMVVIRFVFGSGEAFQPPACYKGISVWFPKKERLFANSMMMGATAFAPMITPLIAVWLMQMFGWKGMFFAFCIPGLIMGWVVWKNLYDNPSDHPAISQEELAEIYDGQPPSAEVPKMPLMAACRVPGLFLLALIYLIFDITYWGFFSWLPSYLVNVRHFAMLKMGVYASMPFMAGFVGLMLANTIGTRLFRGNKIRFLSSIWVIGAASMYFAYAATSAEVCIIFLSLTAGFGIYMSLGPFWALVTETMPSQAMGFLSSIVNGAGKVGGAIAPASIGYLINQSGGDYAAGFFLMEACLLVCAVLIFFVREKKNVPQLNSIS